MDVVKASPRHPVDPLLVIRGLAAMTVVMNHFLGIVWEENFKAMPAWVQVLNPYGFPAVWLFFILSSYLLTSAFITQRFTCDKAGVIFFFKTRALRLLPLFWASELVFGALAILGFSPNGVEFNLYRELNYALLNPLALYQSSLSPLGAINSPLWSVLVEIHFIFLTPLLYIFQRRFKGSLELLLAIWIAFIGLLIARGAVVFPGIYFTHAYNIGFFLVGAIVAFRKHAEGESHTILSPKTVAAIGLLTWVVCQGSATYDLNYALLFTPIAACSGFGCLVYFVDDRYMRKLPNAWSSLIPRSFRPVLWLETIGVMSYSTYLLHKPVIIGILDKILCWPESTHTNSSKAAATVCLLLITIVIGAIGYLYVELRLRFIAGIKPSAQRQV